MKTCNRCTNALFMDFGYSNYTVEGTEFHCMLRLHPEGSFDRFYGTEEKLKFAEQCPRFFEGDPDTLDVERYDEDDLSPQAREYLELGPVKNKRWED